MSDEVKIPEKTSKRGFSKKLVIANNVCAWTVLFIAVPYGQMNMVLGPILSFILVLIGIYTGIGHMDYRKILEITERASERMKPGDKQ